MSVIVGVAVPIPTTLAETLYITFANAIGFLLYAWLIGSFTTAISQVRRSSQSSARSLHDGPLVTCTAHQSITRVL